MGYSYTASESATFTITHARHLAAKVATDLMRVQRFYGHPTDSRIADFEEEITQLLRHGYLDSVAYGFQRDGAWIEPTLKYTAKDFVNGGSDDDPGRVIPGKDVSGAAFKSFLSYSTKYNLLDSNEQAAFESSHPIKRSDGPTPSVNGYFTDDKTYSSGGRALGRATVKSY